MQTWLVPQIKIFIVCLLESFRWHNLWRSSSLVTIQNMIIKVIVQWVIRDGGPGPFNSFFLIIIIILVLTLWEVWPVGVYHLVKYSHYSFLQTNKQTNKKKIKEKNEKTELQRAKCKAFFMDMGKGKPKSLWRCKWQQKLISCLCSTNWATDNLLSLAKPRTTDMFM